MERSSNDAIRRVMQNDVTLQAGVTVLSQGQSVQGPAIALPHSTPLLYSILTLLTLPLFFFFFFFILYHYDKKKNSFEFSKFYQKKFIFLIFQKNFNFKKTFLKNSKNYSNKVLVINYLSP